VAVALNIIIVNEDEGVKESSGSRQKEALANVLQLQANQMSDVDIIVEEF
jgi:hypothetical protein